jgi:hypothetical protein
VLLAVPSNRDARHRIEEVRRNHVVVSRISGLCIEEVDQVAQMDRKGLKQRGELKSFVWREIFRNPTKYVELIQQMLL